MDISLAFQEKIG